MGRQWPVDDIPDSPQFVLDEGMWLMEVESLEETTTREKAKLMYVLTARTVEPTPGMPYYDRFTVGTDDDPDAKDPQTWKKSVAAQRLRNFFKATGVPASTDVSQMTVMAKGKRFVAYVVTQIEDSGAYKGRARNNTRRFYAVGERVPGMNPTSTPRAPAGPPAAPIVVPPHPSESRVTGKATIRCPNCGDDVERADLMGHMAKHVNE